MKEWQTFVRKFSDMNEGRREVFIKDLTDGPEKYDTRHVLARLSREKGTLGDADLLWIRSESGVRYPEPWYLVIEEELDPCVAGQPWQDVFAALAASENKRA